MVVFFVLFVALISLGGRDAMLAAAIASVFVVLTVGCFLFLVRNSLRAVLVLPSGFSVSGSNIGLWTLLLAYELLVALIALALGSVGPLESLLTIGMLGFATGILMGSPLMGPRERAGIALTIGYVAMFPATVIAVPFVFQRGYSYSPATDFLISLVGLGGFLSALTGGLCALGSLLGGFLRRRWTTVALPA